MRNIWTIAKREYRLYFATPIAYMVAFIVLVVMGYFFYGVMLASSLQQYAPGIDVILRPLTSLLLFGTPAITMRLLAEEQRMGTIELLLTAPVRDLELIAGKWLGGFFFMLSLVALTWIFPIALNRMVDPGIDQGPLLTGYLGIILICASLVAIGVAVSATFSNQIAAFFVTLGIIIILFSISFPIEAAGTVGGNLLYYLDFSEHFYKTLLQGLVDLGDIVYYMSVTALAIFLGTKAIEARRWR